MIFSPTEMIAISKVIRMPFDRLKAHLIYQGELITADIKTAVLSEIAAFNGLPNDGVKVHPTESNFGVEVCMYLLLDDARTTIRNLLNIEDAGVRRVLRS